MPSSTEVVLSTSTSTVGEPGSAGPQGSGSDSNSSLGPGGKAGLAIGAVSAVAGTIAIFTNRGRIRNFYYYVMRSAPNSPVHSPRNAPLIPHPGHANPQAYRMDDLGPPRIRQ